MSSDAGAPAGAKAPAAAATWPDFSDGNLGPDSKDDNLGPDSTESDNKKRCRGGLFNKDCIDGYKADTAIWVNP